MECACHKQVLIEVISFLNTQNASIIIVFYYLVIPLNTPRQASLGGGMAIAWA